MSLPWFSANTRRPDLVRSVIYKRNGRLVIDFELIELKFVNHHILDRERIDAIKQVDVGLKEYKQRFSFADNHADAEYWKSELVHYLVEKQAYLPFEVELLKDMQNTRAQDIEVNVSASIDVYCYTSNLTDREFKEVEKGVYVDIIGDSYYNYIYGRHYILEQLGLMSNKFLLMTSFWKRMMSWLHSCQLLWIQTKQKLLVIRK